jgi:hypothetical protein
VCVGLAHPQSCTPYVQIGLMIHLYNRHLFCGLAVVKKIMCMSMNMFVIINIIIVNFSI